VSLSTSVHSSKRIESVVRSREPVGLGHAFELGISDEAFLHEAVAYERQAAPMV
jgi:hypothetical protein